VCTTSVAVGWFYRSIGGSLGFLGRGRSRFLPAGAVAASDGTKVLDELTIDRCLFASIF
jgi:hypothetical protein